MARMKITGLDYWETTLRELGEAAGQVTSAALYAGAGKMVEALEKSIDGIPEQQGYMPKGVQRVSATHDEKKDLKAHIGIAHFEENGGKKSTAVGFEGYSSHPTRKYPKGVPIPMIARSIERGSSVRAPYPFVRRAAQSAKAEIIRAMTEAAEAEVAKTTGGR